MRAPPCRRSRSTSAVGAGSIALAGLLAEDLALTQASARGRLLEGFSGVQLDELYLDTGRGKVEMTATANLGADGVRVMVAGAFHGVPVDDMRRFWPPDAGSGRPSVGPGKAPRRQRR